MKQKLILIISVVIGLFAAFLTRSYLTAKDNEIARMKADFYSRNKKIAVITTSITKAEAKPYLPGDRSP